MIAWHIWMEGYRASGDSSDAQFIGIYPGETFDEAVENYNHHGPHRGQIAKKNGKYWRIWGCRLFYNETESRKSFG